MPNIETPNTEESATQASSDESQNELAAASQDEITVTFPPRPKRWVPHRKAEVLAAVRSGAISLDKACEHYGLSIEEYLSWQRGMQTYGLAGLRVGRPQLRKRSGPRTTDH